jgi:hypothetical protein
MGEKQHSRKERSLFITLIAWTRLDPYLLNVQGKRQQAAVLGPDADLDLFAQKGSYGAVSVPAPSVPP